MQTGNPTTIPALLRAAATRHGARLAVADGAVRLSFSALLGAAERANAAFRAAGLMPGERVALWAPNGWEWIAAACGAQMAGAAIVPLNTRLKGAEAAFILNRSRARILVSAGNFLGIDYARLLADQRLPHLTRHVRIDTDWAGFTVLPPDARDDARPEQASDILFTSGTTGEPKGVVATHGQSVRVFSVWAERVGLHEADRYLVVNPFFHSFGYKAGWLACLIMGAACFPLPALDVARAAALVAAERITVLPGPPTLFVSFLQDPALRAAGYAPLRSLRVAVTGAATIPPALIARMRQDLGIATVLTGYGLTESCGVVTMSHAADPPARVAETCGSAIPGVEIRIAESGEVLVRGYNVMPGYFEDEAATREAIDAEGWLHTGDVGRLDEAGYLQITDRLKDMYISGGFNCYPAEIERLLAGHPAVAQAAVIGVPDARLGEVGLAFIVPRADGAAAEDDILAWARPRIANYKMPRQIRIVPALPLNAAGKVHKPTLRALAAAPVAAVS